MSSSKMSFVAAVTLYGDDWRNHLDYRAAQWAARLEGTQKSAWMDEQNHRDWAYMLTTTKEKGFEWTRVDRMLDMAYVNDHWTMCQQEIPNV
ncbi:MAG: hypothetical protein H7831_15960 [Magnetococcus sp. WYHC-3]